MEDIYEDVSQPLDAPPEPPPPKEPAKTDTVAAPVLPPRNPNAKLTTPVSNVPSLPPRNQPPAPTKQTAPPEPEGIMEEFYEDMDEVKTQYENARSIMDQKSDSARESPVPSVELSVPKANTEKKSPLLKKKELKKEKEQQKKEAEQQKKEAKKREKENKKLKKEKEKSKTLTKGKSKPSENVAARSNSLASTTSTPQPEDDDGEYVVEELSAQDEKKSPSVEPAPIDEEIYEDVVEPLPQPSPEPPSSTTTASSSLVTKPSPLVTATASTKNPALSRPGVFSPPNKLSEYKRNSSPVNEPPRSQSVSPSNVKIRTAGITVSTISKPKPPISVSTSSTTAKTTSSDTPTSTELVTKKPTTSSGGALNRPRVRVSEAIYKFQKRSSTMDAILHSGKLYHKAPGRIKFRQEYCEISGTVLSFYREKGDEKAFATLSLEECELHVEKEQYEGRRYVFCLAAGSSSDMLSAELNVDLQKWLSVLEPLVKKYVKDE